MTPSTRVAPLIARTRELYPGPLVLLATQGPIRKPSSLGCAPVLGLNEYYPSRRPYTITISSSTVEKNLPEKFAAP